MIDLHCSAKGCSAVLACRGEDWPLPPGWTRVPFDPSGTSRGDIFLCPEHKLEIVFPRADGQFSVKVMPCCAPGCSKEVALGSEEAVGWFVIGEGDVPRRMFCPDHKPGTAMSQSCELCGVSTNVAWRNGVWRCDKHPLSEGACKGPEWFVVHCPVDGCNKSLEYQHLHKLYEADWLPVVREVADKLFPETVGDALVALCPEHKTQWAWPGPFPLAQPDDPVNHPAHYTFGGIEVIDAIEAWQLGFHEACVVKYIARAKHKGNEIQDLNKALWYLKRLIAKLEQGPTTEMGETNGQD